MKLTEWAFRCRQFTWVMAVLLVALGAVSLATMPRSEDPQFDFPAASVSVVFPGADAVDLEAQVVEPLEDALFELEDVDKIESTIRAGVAVTRIEFLSGVDPDEAQDDVLSAVGEVRGDFPAGIARVRVDRFSPTDTNIVQLALMSETASYERLERLADRLERRLQRIRGVKRAEVWAHPEQQVRVSLDLDRLREQGLSLDVVTAAIGSESQNLPGGHVELGDRRFNVQTSGDYESVEAIRQTVVAALGERLVRLGDVASVALDYADDTHIGTLDGERAVFVTLNQREGTNIFRIREQVERQLESFRAELPADIELVTAFDQVESVAYRVNGFFVNLLQGVALVGIVILLALGARAAGIVMLLIPLAISIALSWVDYAGYGLQQLSIVGLVIALGLLVDNAIVVVENTSRLMTEGRSPAAAALEGARQVGWPIVSSTVTTVLSFVPIVFMGSGSGDFVRSMPVAVICALIASLLLALTVTPLLGARWLRPLSSERRWPLARLLNRVVAGPYERLLGASLRRPIVVLGLAGSVFVASLGLLPLVGVSFFPAAEKPQFLVDVTTPDGTSLDSTERAVRFVEWALREEPLVRYALGNVGRDNPQVYYNVIPRNERPNVGQVVVELETRDPVATEALLGRLRSRLDSYPGSEFLIRELKNGPPIEAPIAIKVVGPDLDRLTQVASEIESVMHATPGAVEIDNPLATPKTDLALRIDRDKAGLLGVPVARIDQTVRASIAGVPVAVYRDAEGEEREVVVRLPMANGPRLADFERISVASVRGPLVPLRQLAELEFEPVPARIDHYDLERAVTVVAEVEGDGDVAAITRSIAARLERELELPPGYRLVVGGELEALGESFGSLAKALVVALVGIFGVLVLQFRSFSQPLIVFSAIPLAIVGAVLALLVTGWSFSFMAFVGLTSLMGIVVNNSIILVDYANGLRLAGETVSAAVREAARVRFVPIVLTTLTTIAGLLPLTLTNSKLWSPLGWAIIGGLITSALLTLLVVPVLYRVLTPATSA